MLYILSKLGKFVLVSSLVVGPSYPIISKLSTSSTEEKSSTLIAPPSVKEKFCSIVPKAGEKDCETIILENY